MAGEVVHIEIPGECRHSARAAFWSALFGWQFNEIRVPSPEYLLARTTAP